MKSQIPFTEKAISSLPLAENGRYIVRDANLKGFIVIIGQTSKSYFINDSYWKNNTRLFTVKKKIADVNDISLKDARLKAQEWLSLIANGQKPGETTESLPTNAITLKEARLRYKEVHMERKGRSQKTIDEYTKHLNGVLADWLDKPLVELANDPAIVVKKHDTITKYNGVPTWLTLPSAHCG